jgi:hypothetical protein
MVCSESDSQRGGRVHHGRASRSHLPAVYELVRPERGLYHFRHRQDAAPS